MSIVSVTEQFAERGGSIDLMYQRTYTRAFEVITSDPKIGPVAVRLATGIPQPGTFYNNGIVDTDPLYEFDHGAFVNSIKVESWGLDTAWKVMVEYGPYNSSEFGADPTAWKIRVVFGGERTEKVVDFDKTGAPIVNSTGDRFADPVTVDDSILTMTITRNELVSIYDPLLASTFSNTINNATWNGIDAYRLKMGIISTSEPRWAPDAQVWYYEVTYPIQISPNVWKKDLLDQGYNVLVGGVPTPYMPKGQQVTEPIPLDGSGGKLASGGTPVVRTFDVFPETDWSPLGIDLSLRLGA